MPTTEPQSRRANILLAIGACTGIALAASGILEPARPALAETSIARIDDERIDKQDYLAYLDLLAQDKRNPLTAADQRHVLDRMIDEKLLLARGLDMGLAQSSPPVRKAIVQEVMQSILAEVSSQEASDSELQDFYKDNLAYFAKPPRTQLRRLVFRDSDEQSAQTLAEQAWAALQAGEPYAAVAEQFAAEDMLPLPSDPLPDHKLLQYLGPTLTTAAKALHAGDFSKPIAQGKQLVILQVLYKQAMEPRPFDNVRDRVAQEYERRMGDEAMANYLEDLRNQSDLRIDEAFLERIAPERD